MTRHAVSTQLHPLAELPEVNIIARVFELARIEDPDWITSSREAAEYEVDAEKIARCCAELPNATARALAAEAEAARLRAAVAATRAYREAEREYARFSGAHVDDNAFAIALLRRDNAREALDAALRAATGGEA